MKNLYINADDFGLNSSVNKAIIQSFNNNCINSTTIMANMPGFEEAVKLAHTNDIIDRIGVHLNLTEGLPLTSNILKTNLLLSNSNLNLKHFKLNLFLLSKKEKELIFKEFSAQIEKVRKVGIQITHVDTHHHLEEVWPIAQIILKLIKVYNIPSMRVLNNLNKSSKGYKIIYRKILNRYLKLKGANFSDLHGNQIDVFTQFNPEQLLLNEKKVEIMVHPDYNEQGFVIDRLQNKEISLNFNHLLNTF